PDGGVECFWIDPAGDVHGYQAKYLLESLGTSQWTQLDESFAQALKRYPRLVSYTVCLPQDLPHSPRKGGQTARNKWEARRQQWIDAAARVRRTVAIELWGEQRIIAQLAEPESAGLIWFFFGTEVLTPSGVRQRVAEQT